MILFSLFMTCKVMGIFLYIALFGWHFMLACKCFVTYVLILLHHMYKVIVFFSVANYFTITHKTNILPITDLLKFNFFHSEINGKFQIYAFSLATKH